MKKLLSILLLLSIATPALPMQRAKEIIKKYTLPTLQVTAGATALGLSAYGMYKYTNTSSLLDLASSFGSFSYSSVSISGNGIASVITRNGVSDIRINGKTYNNIRGNNISVTNGRAFIDGKPLDASSEVQQNTDAFISNPYVFGATALAGTLLMTAGISNFKKAYNS